MQFIQKTFWNQLDYLIIDLPPGTGDIQLTIAHKIKTKGIVMVTTPQYVVLGDVQRALDMYEERKIPVLAVVENMSGLVCESCGHLNKPFGTLEKKFVSEVPCYITLPLDTKVSRTGDEGVPITAEDPTHTVSQSFRELATHVTHLSHFEASKLQPVN